MIDQATLQEGRALLVPDEYGTVPFSALAVFFHRHGAALLDLANDYEFDVNVPLSELREENDRLRAALMSAGGVLERLGRWFIETEPPASKEFEVEIVQTVERIISDLQVRDSGL